MEATKEELRNFSELSDDIYKVLEKHNITGKNVKEFLFEVAKFLGKEPNYQSESGAHFAIPIYVKRLREHIGNKPGTIIVLPSAYGRSITGLAHHVSYINLLPSEIERVLKLKSFM